MKHLFLSFFGTLIIFMISYPALSSDYDNDGIEDRKDLCPNTRQLKKLPANFKYKAAVNPDRLLSEPRSYPVDINGCEPDSDGDGVINSLDYCPYDNHESLSMGTAVNGCPKQSDADGTPDYRDKCPGTPHGVKTDRYGCEIRKEISYL